MTLWEVRFEDRPWELDHRSQAKLGPKAKSGEKCGFSVLFRPSDEVINSYRSTSAAMNLHELLPAPRANGWPTRP
jgi:hypothetical protein